MIGVVVWSSELREKAVIWCEDHGALAYLQGREHVSGDGWPTAGDLLELESETIGTMRHARSVAIVTEGRCPRIPALLRGTRPVDPEPLRVVVGGGRKAATGPMRADRREQQPLSAVG